MLNPDCATFKIAKIVNRENCEPVDKCYTLQHIEIIDDLFDFDFNKIYEHMSFKSKKFID